MRIRKGQPRLPFLFSDTLPPVNQPTPAIVSQDAVRRLPRWALLLFCVDYVVPGFVGRAPWKSADMTTLGYIFELAHGASSWLQPTLAGQPPEFDALLPYWLGAWAMQLGSGWMAPDFDDSKWAPLRRSATAGRGLEQWQRRAFDQELAAGGVPLALPAAHAQLRKRFEFDGGGRR